MRKHTSFAGHNDPVFLVVQFFVRFAACIPILSHPNALCVLLLWEKTRTQAKF